MSHGGLVLREVQSPALSKGSLGTFCKSQRQEDGHINSGVSTGWKWKTICLQRQSVGEMPGKQQDEKGNVNPTWKSPSGGPHAESPHKARLGWPQLFSRN